MNKLKPGPANAQTLRSEVAPARVNLFVRFSGSIDNLLRLGLQAPTVVEDPRDHTFIAAGSIPADRLGDLAKEPNVIRVERSQALRPLLDTSVPAIHADALRSRVPAITGAGVLVGIVDTGIDYRHRNFRTGSLSQSSRVLRLWDQTLAPNRPAETAPTAFPSLGVEYTREQIQIALTTEKPGFPANPFIPPGVVAGPAAPLRVVRSTDTRGRNDRLGHGSFVAGVAAGNATEPGQCTTASFFGVATEADLVVVKPSIEADANLDGQGVGLIDSTNIVHAVQYIFLVADAQSRPVVVNISLGDNLGPHDGSTLFEQLLEATITQDDNGTIVGRPGRSIVAAAGNEADDFLHASLTIPPGATRDLVFRVPPVPAYVTQPDDFAGGAYRRAERIDIRHDGGTALEVSVTPAGSATTYGPVKSGEAPPPFDLNPTETNLQLRTQLRIERTDLSTIRLFLMHPGYVDTAQRMGAFTSGAWRIHLSSKSASDTMTVNCWLQFHLRGGDVDRAPPKIPYWRLSFKLPGESNELTPSDPNWTVIAPASAAHVIAVGAYDHHDVSIANFSNRGRPNVLPDAIKPDLVAPGVGIKSVRANAIDRESRAFAFNWCSRCCYDFYRQADGTSFSSPHVAGVVALMLQVNPTLDALSIRDILRATADTPVQNPPLSLPNNIWGYGIVNAAAAVDQAQALAAKAGVRAANAGAASPGQARSARRLRRRSLAPSPLTVLRTLHLPTSSLGSFLVSKHFSEVRRLIDTNPRVALLWHRSQGPELVKHTIHSLQGKVPTASGSLTEPRTRQGRRWSAFFAALSRLGSPRLRTDLECYESMLLEMIMAEQNPRGAAGETGASAWGA